MRVSEVQILLSPLASLVLRSSPETRRKFSRSRGFLHAQGQSYAWSASSHVRPMIILLASAAASLWSFDRRCVAMMPA